MFKLFLRKNLGNSKVFMDNYWAKIKRDSKYQLEKVLDRVVYLKYLQVVLKEFDSVIALNKDILVWYF